MKPSHAAVFLLLALAVGCIYPTGRKAERGQVYSNESLAFLNETNTARSEVVSTLGEPYFESTNFLVLVYRSETYIKWRGMGLEPDLDEDLNLVYRPETVSEARSGERLQALCVAFNTNNLVRSYTLRKISEGALNPPHLEELCRRQAQLPAKAGGQ
jgi:hypothetical protein